MLAVLEEKAKALGVTNVRTVVLDFERDASPQKDVRPGIVVSAMTLHHIKDTGRFAGTLYGLLPTGGRIALADLDTESGDFHADNTGVEHFGFDREVLKRVFTDVGFRDISITTAYEMVRSVVDGEKTFPIFLLSARKP
jgi:hypothetical protein